MYASARFLAFACVGPNTTADLALRLAPFLAVVLSSHTMTFQPSGHLWNVQVAEHAGDGNGSGITSPPPRTSPGTRRRVCEGLRQDPLRFGIGAACQPMPTPLRSSFQRSLYSRHAIQRDLGFSFNPAPRLSAGSESQRFTDAGVRCLQLNGTADGLVVFRIPCSIECPMCDSGHVLNAVVCVFEWVFRVWSRLLGDLS
jgi:hypothetical protein